MLHKLSHNQIGEKFGISQAGVSQIVKKRRFVWDSLPDHEAVLKTVKKQQKFYSKNGENVVAMKLLLKLESVVLGDMTFESCSNDGQPGTVIMDCRFKPLFFDFVFSNTVLSFSFL